MSADQHIAPDVLSNYADDPTSVANREDIETHLAACAACWTKLDDYRQFNSALADEESWFIAQEVATNAVTNDLSALSERVAAEDAEARRILEPFLDSHYRFTFANVTGKRRFRTAGVARVLCRTAHDEADRQPRFARLLAESAAIIAEALPDSYYPAGSINEIRGTAWKECATACRYMGEFRDGYDALDRAERAYRRLIDPGLHIGVVALSRGLLLWEQQRYPEALVQVRTAGECFLRRRDTARYLQAKESEAAVLHRLGDLDAASETYQKVMSIAETTGDADRKARAARNLGVVSGDRGDTGSASKYLLLALQLYEALGREAMIVRTRWSIAWISLVAGNAFESARRLPTIIADLVALGMSSDAARAQLDLAEALLVLGRLDEVVEVCSALVSYFRHAGMRNGSLTAAAFLTEAAHKRVLKRQDVVYVREYLIKLERQPDLPFARPSDNP